MVSGILKTLMMNRWWCIWYDVYIIWWCIWYDVYVIWWCTWYNVYDVWWNDEMDWINEQRSKWWKFQPHFRFPFPHSFFQSSISGGLCLCTSSLPFIFMCPSGLSQFQHPTTWRWQTWSTICMKGQTWHRGQSGQTLHVDLGSFSKADWFLCAHCFTQGV